MRSVTIKEAKAKLSELIDAATRGEDVVLLRGSHHVAAIVPITDADLELGPRISDAQARSAWKRLATEREAGTTAVFDDAREAVEHLRASTPRGSSTRKVRATRPR